MHGIWGLPDNLNGKCCNAETAELRFNSGVRKTEEAPLEVMNRGGLEAPVWVAKETCAGTRMCICNEFLNFVT